MKVKAFAGCSPEQINEWLELHPDAEVLSKDPFMVSYDNITTGVASCFNETKSFIMVGANPELLIEAWQVIDICGDSPYEADPYGDYHECLGTTLAVLKAAYKKFKIIAIEIDPDRDMWQVYFPFLENGYMGQVKEYCTNILGRIHKPIAGIRSIPEWSNELHSLRWDDPEYDNSVGYMQMGLSDAQTASFRKELSALQS